MEPTDVAHSPRDGFIALTGHSVVIAANDFNGCIREAATLDALQTVQDALDIAIGALLAQEQILVLRREMLTLGGR